MNCPCCSAKLLQHINRHGLYWYCVSCRQTMFDANKNTWRTDKKNYSSIKN